MKFVEEYNFLNELVGFFGKCFFYFVEKCLNFDCLIDDNGDIVMDWWEF